MNVTDPGLHDLGICLSPWRQLAGVLLMTKSLRLGFGLAKLMVGPVNWVRRLRDEREGPSTTRAVSGGGPAR